MLTANSSEKRLQAGDRPAAGDTVYLRCSDTSREPPGGDWFESDGDWVCPATIAGYYYTVLTREDLEREMRDAGF